LPYLKLHRTKLVLHISSKVLYLGPRNASRNGLLRFIVERHHALHHPVGFPDGAVLIVRRVSVLLEEVVLDEAGDEERHLVVVGEGLGTDQLDDLLEFFRGRVELLDLIAVLWEVRVVLLIVFVEGSDVLAVGYTNVDGGKVYISRKW